jgi:hypothetical protein
MFEMFSWNQSNHLSTNYIEKKHEPSHVGKEFSCQLQMGIEREGPKLLVPITSDKNRQQFDKILVTMICATNA